MEPTYEQVQFIIEQLFGDGENIGWLERIVQMLDLIRLTLLFGFGFTVGSLWWRNFILAKNQREFM
jgi:hypothetical protein